MPKIAKGIWIFIKARHYRYKHTLLSLYNTFIYPYSAYSNIVWGGTFKNDLVKLYLLQEKISSDNISSVREITKNSSTFSVTTISSNMIWLLQLHDTIQMK